jgi:hypothetical protein
MLALMIFNTRTYAFCFWLLALALHPLASIGQSSSNAFDLIPYPQTLEPGEGNFTVTAQTKNYNGFPIQPGGRTTDLDITARAGRHASRRLHPAARPCNFSCLHAPAGQ